MADILRAYRLAFYETHARVWPGFGRFAHVKPD